MFYENVCVYAIYVERCCLQANIADFFDLWGVKGQQIRCGHFLVDANSALVAICSSELKNVSLSQSFSHLRSANHFRFVDFTMRGVN